GFCGRGRVLPAAGGGEDVRPRRPNAGPAGQAHPRPPVGPGRADPGREGVHPGPPGAADRAADGRVSRPPAAGGRGPAAGHLGRVADPPPGGGDRLRGREPRPGAGGSPARVCPGPEPVGRGRLAPAEERRTAEPGLPGSGGVARGVPPGGRPTAAATGTDTILLRSSRAETHTLRSLNFSARGSVARDGFPSRSNLRIRRAMFSLTHTTPRVGSVANKW